LVAATLYVMPVRPGRSDDFRAFVADLMRSRRVEWAESHRRRGVTRQVVFIGRDGGGRDLAMIYSESPDPESAFTSIAASDHPFDRWLAEKMSELLEARIAVESLADTAPKPGPWRGWRRLRR
jgi:hypothetical protein